MELICRSSVSDYNASPIGQAFLLHIWVSLASPTHSLPPYFGAGSLHRRLRVWTPPPQVRVQVSHGDQGPQLPLTKADKKKTWFISILAVYNTQMQPGSKHLMVGLTWARRLLTLLGLPALSLTVLASKLRGGGVAEADTGDDTSTTGDWAGWPGWPMAPAAVLLDWRPQRKIRG